MISRLVDAPSSTVRRWVRRGYLKPIDDHPRLRSFGFEQLKVAQSLSSLAKAGLSLSRIDQVLDQLVTLDGAHAEDFLAHFRFHVDGGEVIVEREGEFSDPSGQKMLRFERQPEPDDASIPFSSASTLVGVEQMRLHAEQLLEFGDLQQAEEQCRAVLFTGQGTLHDQLALADTLYRRGDLTAARERYLVCIELDEDCIEARLSLGALYAELGSLELAESALEGVLQLLPDSPDALIQLAEVQDQLGKADQACFSRRRLVKHAPEGPWSEQARRRIGADLPCAEQLANPSD